MFSVLTALRFLALAWAFVPALGAPPPLTNLGTVVNLRIEGAEKTTFEGLIFTRGHNVTTVSGGTRHCDGTNHGENLTPGPTCTSALDDAAKENHFTFDGTVFGDFDDFFITRIANDSQTDTQFWGILLNFQFTPVGGCQQEVKLLDEVLWAFDAFSKTHFLKLDGPVIAKLGQPVTFTVTDGSDGTPLDSATVVSSGRGAGEQVSDANGKVTFTFATKGAHVLKADRSDSIRSNAVTVAVV